MDHLSHLIEEPLASTHISHVEEFICENRIGNSCVQLFLQEQALKLMTQNLVRNRLLFDQHKNLIGFYSLFNDAWFHDSFLFSELLHS